MFIRSSPARLLSIRKREMDPIYFAQKSKGIFFVLIIVSVVLCGSVFAQSINAEAARDQILAGVTSMHSGVQPGMMIAYGDNAYNIAWYPGGASGGALITAAGWGHRVESLLSVTIRC